MTSSDVKEEEIASAILMLMERKRVVAEGAGAVPLAALLSRKASDRGEEGCSGIRAANIDVNLLDRIIEKASLRREESSRFGVLVRDVPTLGPALSG